MYHCNIIIIELTVLQDCFSKSGQRKTCRYSNLVSDCCADEWNFLLDGNTVVLVFTRAQLYQDFKKASGNFKL